MTVELVEAAIGRIMLVFEAEVPFADRPGGVAGTLQMVAEGQLAGDETDIRHFG